MDVEHTRGTAELQQARAELAALSGVDSSSGGLYASSIHAAATAGGGEGLDQLPQLQRQQQQQQLDGVHSAAEASAGDEGDDSRHTHVGAGFVVELLLVPLLLLVCNPNHHHHQQQQQCVHLILTLAPWTTGWEQAENACPILCGLLHCWAHHVLCYAAGRW
jgi:hypothetical protein